MIPRPEKCPFCSAPVEGTGPVCEQCGFELDREWTPASEDEARAVFDPGQRACTVCGGLNPLGADYCSKCSAPVGDCAGWKPLESAVAQGFAIRRGTEGLPGMPLPARIGRVLLGLAGVGATAVGLYRFLGAVPILGELPEMAAAGVGSAAMAMLIGFFFLLPLALTVLIGYVSHCLLFGGSAGRGLPEEAPAPGSSVGEGGQTVPAGTAPSDAKEDRPARRTGLRPWRGLVTGLLVLAALPVVHAASTGAPPRHVPWDESRVHFDPSVAIWGIHGARGLDLTERGQHAEAIEELRLAVKERPDSADLHYGLAYSLAMTGDHPGAVAECREAIRLRPDFAPLHALLGWALCAAGDAEGAAKAYREAVRLAPGDAEAHAGLGYALLRCEDPGGAVRAYREAVRLKPASAEFHNYLGDALARDRDFDGALAACREALRLKPDLAEAQVTLGAVLLELGRDDEALAALREAARLAPDHWYASYLLARAHARKGDAVSAAEFLGRAAKLRPECRTEALVEEDFKNLDACRELLELFKVVPAGQPPKPETPPEP